MHIPMNFKSVDDNNLSSSTKTTTQMVNIPKKKKNKRMREGEELLHTKDYQHLGEVLLFATLDFATATASSTTATQYSTTHRILIRF